MIEEKKEYKKHNSFIKFSSSTKNDSKNILIKIKKILNNQSYLKDLSLDNLDIIKVIKKDLFSSDIKRNSDDVFQLSQHVIDDLNILEDQEIPKYLIHRYRYEIYPIKKIIDDFPPYLQIEPSSICNYRCVFCFETDKSFTNKKMVLWAQ